MANCDLEQPKVENPAYAREDALEEKTLEEETLKVYIGTKIIKAEPMDEETFIHTVKNEPTRADQETGPGYKVIYSDGYTSWSPKDVFEKAYREITSAEIKSIEA